MNNLYGTSMTEKLPIKDFRFLTQEEIAKQFPLNTIDVADDSEIGFILECDLSYPKEYHDLHNFLSMVAENIIIDESMYSPFQKSFPK